MKMKTLALVTSLVACSAVNAQWDSVVGGTSIIEGYDRYWVSVRRGGTVYLVDADTGDVKGTLYTSNFSPAIAPDLKNGKIYSYGAFYTRTEYGDRTDLVLEFDASTTEPIGEVEIPARSAGIGHPGMIGLINDKFIGVWNITPATTVSLVDTETDAFVSEVALPSCSGINPIAQGWLSMCGDGTAQYVELNMAGQETRRVTSDPFFDVFEDPVFDYAVPSNDGWMFMSFEGLLRKVTFDGAAVNVTEPFDINPETNGTKDINGVERMNDDDWRIVGSQPFTFHDDESILVTIMHEGGGQEVFEDPGTEIWGFNMKTGNRGYRIELEDGATARSVLMTPGEDPLLLVSTDKGLQVRDPRSGRLLRTVEMLEGGTLQSLYEGM